jgi:MacB-like periplasmic core domain
MIEDLRIAGRALRRSPLFAGIAAASIALGIAAVSVIFALVDALLLRPLAAPQPERLVRVGLSTHGQGFGPVSYPDFVELRDAVPAFAGLLGHAPNDVVLTVGTQPRTASMEIVTGNYFEVLGVHPSPGPVATGRASGPWASGCASRTAREIRVTQRLSA